MKKILLLMISVLLVTVMIAGLPFSAYAEVNNTIKTKGNTTPVTDSAVHSGELEQLLEDCKVEQLPKKNSYLEEPIDMYMDSGKATGAHAYIKPNAKASKIVNIYQGMPVQLFAIEGDWGCVSFYDHTNEKKAGWVYLENLSENYPGETTVFGKANLDKYEDEIGVELVAVQPGIEKSGFNFVDTKTRYFTLDKAWANEPCAALIFDYQVISRNGVIRAYGERDVYINGGDGWEYAGSFDVSKDFAPVHCELYFDEASVVKALAVIPVGASAENFEYRLNIDKAYYVSE